MIKWSFILKDHRKFDLTWYGPFNKNSDYLLRDAIFQCFSIDIQYAWYLLFKSWSNFTEFHSISYFCNDFLFSYPSYSSYQMSVYFNALFLTLTSVIKLLRKWFNCQTARRLNASAFVYSITTNVHLPQTSPKNILICKLHPVFDLPNPFDMRRMKQTSTASLAAHHRQNHYTGLCDLLAVTIRRVQRAWNVWWCESVKDEADEMPSISLTFPFKGSRGQRRETQLDPPDAKSQGKGCEKSALVHAWMLITARTVWRNSESDIIIDEGLGTSQTSAPQCEPDQLTL